MHSVFAAALLAVVIWSGGPIATKLAVNELPPLAVALGRICFGSIIVMPFAVLLRLPLPHERQQIVTLILSSASGFIAFPLLFCIGMTMTSGADGVMIQAFLPIFTGLIANVWDHRLPRISWWAGCGLALIGELLILKPVFSTGPGTLTGVTLVWISAFFLAFGYVAGGRLAQAGYSSQATTYWGVGLATLAMAPFVPFVFAGIDVKTVGAEAWVSLAYLAVGVTVVGYVLWYWALGRGGIAKIGLLQFLQPVCGLVLAYLILTEPLSSSDLLAAALIVGGVAIARA